MLLLRFKNLWPYLCIAVLSLATYRNALNNGFALDDLIQIQHNQALMREDYGYSVLTEPVFPGNLYRPATFLTYYVQHAVTGMDPLPFHLLNILLHALAGIVLFIVSKKFISTFAALSIVSIFIVHPLFVEVVANVSGRAEIQAALFVLIGLYAALLGENLNANSGRKLTIVALSAFLAAASKESGLVMTPLLFLLLWVRGKSSLRSTSFSLVASMLGALSYLVLRISALGGALYSPLSIDSVDNPLATISLFDRLILALNLLGMYLQKLFVPLPLNADYSGLFQSYFFMRLELKVLTALLVISIFSISLFLVIAKRSSIGAGVAWFFTAFSLTANLIFPIGTIFAERLAYLPSCGLLISLGVVGSQIPFRKLSPLLALLVIVAGFQVASNQTGHWRNNDTLADYQQQVSPDSFRTQLLLARSALNSGEKIRAKIYLRRSLELLPANDEANHLLGGIALEEKELIEAEEYFQRALTVNPRFIPTLNMYGRLLLNQGRLQEAQHMANQIWHTDRKNTDGLLILLALALKSGDTTRAKELEVELINLRESSADFETLRKHLTRQLYPVTPVK